MLHFLPSFLNHARRQIACSMQFDSLQHAKGMGRKRLLQTEVERSQWPHNLVSHAHAFRGCGHDADHDLRT